ncbi:MAG TPA: ABC transporter permease [Chitinophagaceae bacterium]|nr:ABC transporter permease [Chitinophagaceae bacterium]
MSKNWWKIVSVLLLIYTVGGGLLLDVPRLAIVNETIRALYFHVPMWFGMMILFIVSVVYSIKFLSKPSDKLDIYASEYARSGVILGILGIATGAVWARYQWGAYWSGDPKQNGAAIAVLIYLAYFVLRGSFTDVDKRNRVAAVYNIFAFAMLFPTIWILPRLTESLHPGGEGSEGNPALNGRDLAPEMRMVFWPAVLGWTLLTVWITTLRIRTQLLIEKQLQHAK